MAGQRKKRNQNELVFLPLGGVGEIGMNLYLYGYGTPWNRQWLVVDLGVTFAGEAEPGIDVILPDIRFAEEERGNLLGILLTHAHEDHFGAVIDLWPRLNAPLYATPFTAALLRAKLIEQGLEDEIKIQEIALKSRTTIGPFDIELVNMAHSIPETNGVVLRTELGNIFHTSDWKLDSDPIISPPTDEKRLREIGQEGVDAVICDSTNVLRDGVSPSEGDVAMALARIISEAPKCVAVTTFASNVARIHSVAKAAHLVDRHVVLVGRAMKRVIQVAKETGYIDPEFEFLSEDEFGYLPREKVVALCTGSQGERRAALSRIASGDHPNVSLVRGDLAIFSSRTIPGNEKDVSRVQNNLADLGVDIVTDNEALVHVSGHPRRDEIKQLYEWLRPKALVPVHGEARHLVEHAKFAKTLGIENVAEARNGTIARLIPGPAEIVDEAPVGRLHRDGRLIIGQDSVAVAERRKLGFSGFVAVSIVLERSGELVCEPALTLAGLPELDEEGVPLEESILNEIAGVLDSIPRPRRKDPNLAGEAVRRGVRAIVNQIWGKKPLCAVMVTYV